MSYAIELYRRQPFNEAQRLLSLPREALRRQVFQNVQEGNHRNLCELMTAHLLAFGEVGGRISDHTVRSYTTSVRQYLTFAQENAVNVLRATPDHGLLWVRGMEDAGKAAATVRVRMAGVRALYRALRWATDVQADPLQDVKATKDPTPPWEKRMPYQGTEINSLVNASPPTFRRLILMCAHAGLRISEALKVKPEDVAGEYLTVRNGKGGKARRVVLSKTLKESFEQAPLTAGDSMTYQAARHTLKALCELTKTPYRAWHAMRHYAGTRLSRETGSLECVARHLGHTNLATARIYAKWSDEALIQSVGNW